MGEMGYPVVVACDPGMASRAYTKASVYASLGRLPLPRETSNDRFKGKHESSICVASISIYTNPHLIGLIVEAKVK